MGFPIPLEERNVILGKANGSGISLRLVFTSDGLVVGVLIGRVERYDPVKIKPTESEAEQ